MRASRIVGLLAVVASLVLLLSVRLPAQERTLEELNAEILSESGPPKPSWVNPAGGHMGRGPGGSSDYALKMVVIPWLRAHLSPPSW